MKTFEWDYTNSYELFTSSTKRKIVSNDSAMRVYWKHHRGNAHSTGHLTCFYNVQNSVVFTSEAHTFKSEKTKWSCLMIHPEHKCTETQDVYKTSLMKPAYVPVRQRKGSEIKASLCFDQINWTPGTLPVNKLWIMQLDCVFFCIVVSAKGEIMHFEILQCLKLFAFNRSVLLLM